MNIMPGFRFIARLGALSLALTLFTNLSAQSLQTGQGSGWVKLGEKKVNRKLDRDEIPVVGQNSLFTALQFRVSRSHANIARCSIYFENGKVKNVRLGQNIGEGGESKVIKFGLFGPRSVKKVVLWYDTMDEANKKAVVEVWARP